MIDFLLAKYDEAMQDAHPRVSDLSLMANPIWNTVSVLVYLYIVFYGGPAFMKNRKPFHFPKILFAYNMALVALSAYMFYEFLAAGWWNDFSLQCEECDYSVSEKTTRMMNVCWLFWLSKHIEFFDTYFFILKAKWDHISTLHVVHHTLMAFTWWFGVKFSPGGAGSFHAMVNCLVHTIMYFYYGISALGPEYRKYLWWKKYLTTFQMCQFIVVVVHMANIMIRFPTCKYPTPFKFIIVGYGVLFYYLFAGFFKKAYVQKPSSNNNKTK